MYILIILLTDIIKIDKLFYYHYDPIIIQVTYNKFHHLIFPVCGPKRRIHFHRFISK